MKHSPKGNPNQNIKDYLNYYTNIENPQFAVLINGKWGSGKTHFIKTLIKDWEIKPSKNQDDSDNINLKPIYISLYGVKNKAEIIEKIREILNPLLYSKSVKILKQIALGAIKATTSINLDMNADMEL